MIGWGLVAKNVGGAIVKFFTSLPWWVYLVAALIVSHLWYGSMRYNAAEEIGKTNTAAVQKQFDQYRADVVENARLATIAAKKTEQQQRDAFAALDAKHKKDLNDAKLKHDDVVAGLRAGNLRLRKHWQGCAAPVSDMSSATGAAGVLDEDAELRAAGAGDIVRLTSEADSQITGLQSALKVCLGVGDG